VDERTPIALSSRPRKFAEAHRRRRTGAPNDGAEEDRNADEDFLTEGGDNTTTLES
jgi:hypothetical protein